MRAVLDTNVLVSGFVRSRPDSAPVQSLDAWRAAAFTVIVSAEILQEVERTLAAPYFQARLAEEQASARLPSWWLKRM